MKRIFLSFTLALCFQAAIAQTVNQKGFVQSISYVYGESGEPIEDVRITVLTEVRSNENGTFVVPVSSSGNGVFSFKEIQKSGYTLISPKSENISEEFFAINPDADIRIVMASKEALFRERRRIESNMRKSLEAEIQARDDEISAMKAKIDSLQSSSVSVGELESQVRAKQQELDRFKEEYFDSYSEIENEAKTLSEIDYCALSEVEAKIVELKKAGKGVEAAELAKSQISSKLWKKINSDPTSVKRELEKKRKDLEEAEKSFTEARKMLYSTFEGYRIAFRHEEAARYLKLYADMDPKDYDGLLAYASFLIQVLDRFDEATEYLNLILNDEKAPVKARVDAKTFLGNISSLKGFKLEAIEMFEEALSIAKQHNVTKSIISLQNNIAYSYVLLDDFRRAVELYRDALLYKDSPEMSEKSLAHLYVGLADALTNISETDEAKSCLDKVYERFDQLRADGDIFILSQYYTVLAAYYNQMGDNAGRIEASEKSIELITGYYGEAHSNLGIEYNNIASAYLENGQYSTAADYLKKGMDILARSRGTSHPSYLTMMIKCSQLEIRLGKYDEALAGLLSIESEINGSDRRNFEDLKPFVYQLIAICYNRMNEMEKAAAYYSNYLQSTIEKYGKIHSETANAYNSMGTYYHAIGEHEKERQCYETSIEILKSLLPENHFDFVLYYHNLASVLYRLGEKEKAMSYFMDALKIAEENGTHPLTEAQINKSIAANLNGDGRYDEAYPYIDKAVRIYGESEDIIGYLESLVDASVIYSNGLKFEKSLELAQKGLSVNEQKIGKRNRYAATFLYKQGVAYFVLGDYASAGTMLKDAYDLFKEIKKENSTSANECLALLEEMNSLDKPHLYICTIVKDGPAEKRGLEGEYFILKFNEWDCLSSTSLIGYSATVSNDSSKEYVLMASDGSIRDEKFGAGRVGVNYKLKLVSEEQYSKVLKAYRDYLSARP